MWLTELTPEQEALIPVYREKWKSIALSTQPIDAQKAEEAVKEAYTSIGLAEPEIIFCDSPHAAWNTALNQPETQLGKPLEHLSAQLGYQLVIPLWSQLNRQVWDYLGNQLIIELRSKLDSRLDSNSQLSSSWGGVDAFRLTKLVSFEGELEQMLWSALRQQERNRHCIRPEVWACISSWFDFCFSVLNCDREQKTWSVLESLVSKCGWIYSYDKICLICDRPTKLSFDSEQRLHASGESVVQFADGFSVYAHHGVRLPEKYGKLPPREWSAQWLLEEHNAELRRVLIQEIGCTRICQELQGEPLDTWQDYTLLKIDYDFYNSEQIEQVGGVIFVTYTGEDVDMEPIYLLTMTCPSTKKIHALRVPPDMKSAREAIRWVNLGIDPEEFGVQT
jgi:hypothetical protein